MIYNRKKQTAAVLSIVGLMLFSGCTDISQREFIYIVNSEGPNDGVGGDLLIITSSAPSVPQTTDSPNADEPDISALFTPQEQEFINSSLFMGDSVCLGLGVYGLVRNYAAKAGIAARNIEGSTFDSSGTQVSPYTAIINSGCKNLVFLMGINDVNIESSDEYIAYYDAFLKKVEALAAGKTIYILSITPVTADSTFCYNYQIEEFNSKLKAMSEATGRRYVDIASELKDEKGNLIKIYASDNSVHLTKSAYYRILSALCKAAKE